MITVTVLYITSVAHSGSVIGESPVQVFKWIRAEIMAEMEWNRMEWSEGCVSGETWRCREKNKDSFFKFSNMKVPDTRKTWVNKKYDTLRNARPNVGKTVPVWLLQIQISGKKVVAVLFGLMIC